MSDDNNIRSFDSNMRCHVFKDYNMIFDEKNSSCGVLRKVQWIKGDATPDESKAKLELRKIYNGSEGEKMGKGYTFSTEDGPSELVIGLIDNGFGDTAEIITHVKDRDDFVPAVKAISFEDASIEGEDGEVFDMRDLLLNDLDGDDEDESA